MQQSPLKDGPLKRNAKNSRRGRGHRGHRNISRTNRDVGEGGQEIARDRRQNLTHFIAIPLGHIPSLRDTISRFTTSLVAQSPPIPGLDESIVIPARRLHLTLGVMSLTNGDQNDAASFATGGKTVTSALSFLQNLRPRIVDALGGGSLRIPLSHAGIMKPERGNAERAHVMFAGPAIDEPLPAEVARLKRVCDLINQEFIREGFAVDERRPLKLHCTILNTTYRKPRPRGGGRVPFSFSDVIASDAFKRIAASAPHHEASSNQTTTGQQTDDGSQNDMVQLQRKSKLREEDRRYPVELGTYEVSEIQICEMGSHGPEGEYVSVGKVEL